MPYFPLSCNDGLFSNFMINLLLAMHLQTRLTGLYSVLIYAVKHDCVFGVDNLRIDEIELVSQVPCSCFLAIQFHLGNK